MKDQIKGLDETLTAEAKYPINFTQSGKRFVFTIIEATGFFC